MCVAIRTCCSAHSDNKSSMRSMKWAATERFQAHIVNVFFIVFLLWKNNVYRHKIPYADGTENFSKRSCSLYANSPDSVLRLPGTNSIRRLRLRSWLAFYEHLLCLKRSNSKTQILIFVRVNLCAYLNRMP